ncbi:MFS transporter [Tunicatimonas pelagia]|uniref:MFS transporter n=1 Tax=Tunicatimonas pelagia TaxID=931531 RepID=UPI0026650796|nr:MFS transporter [Tunicatimonas pelagia]WKN44828.1 MFS transporter [Tunicatimonas pelagia]
MSTSVATSTRAWSTKLTLLLASTLTVMSGATISPSLPQIRDVFAATPNAEMLSRLVLTIPALFIAGCAPVAGYIVDRFGRKSLLLGSLALYAVAGSSGLYLDSLTAILVGRALLGVAVAGVMTTVVTLIGDYFEGEGRTSFMGLQAAFMGLGGVLFISGGGYLADIGWRWPFAIYFFSLLVVPLTIAYLPEPAPTEKPNPTTGSAPTDRFSPTTIALLFVVVIVNMIMFYMVPVQMPFFLSETIQVNNTRAGVAISLMTFSSAVTSLFYRRIKARFGFYTIYALVFSFMALGYGLIAQSTTYTLVVVALLLAGVGSGLFLPNVNLQVMALAPPRLRGRLVSGVTSAMFLGQFLSPLAVAPLVQNFTLGDTFGLAAGGLLAMALGFLVVVLFERNSSKVPSTD